LLLLKIISPLLRALKYCSNYFKFSFYSFDKKFFFALILFYFITWGEMIKGEFKHEVRQFQKPYDNQQAEQISLMV